MLKGSKTPLTPCLQSPGIRPSSSLSSFLKYKLGSRGLCVSMANILLIKKQNSVLMAAATDQEAACSAAART